MLKVIISCYDFIYSVQCNLPFNGDENDELNFLFVLGLFGKAKCGCACRDYYVPKCEITYVEKCSYEHYEQVIKHFPILSFIVEISGLIESKFQPKQRQFNLDFYFLQELLRIFKQLLVLVSCKWEDRICTRFDSSGDVFRMFFEKSPLCESMGRM